MDNDLHQKYHHIITAIGEQKVSELYQLLGAEKISMATLQKVIAKDKIEASLDGKKTITHLASEHGVSRMTIYRQLKKSK